MTSIIHVSVSACEALEMIAEVITILADAHSHAEYYEGVSIMLMAIF
jgi:hypothetical protein